MVKLFSWNHPDAIKKISTKFDWKFLAGFQNLEVWWIRNIFFARNKKFEVSRFGMIGCIKILRISSKKFPSAAIFEDEFASIRTAQISKLLCKKKFKFGWNFDHQSRFLVYFKNMFGDSSKMSQLSRASNTSTSILQHYSIKVLVLSV